MIVLSVVICTSIFVVCDESRDLKNLILNSCENMIGYWVPLSYFFKINIYSLKVNGSFKLALWNRLLHPITISGIKYE